MKISPSALKMFLRCPRQYEFRYIRGFVLPPRGALIKGTAAHKGAEVNLQHKIETGEDLPVEAVQDVVAAAFENLRPTAEFAKDEDPGRLKDAAVRSAVAWRTKVAPAIRPVAVEQWAEAETPEGNIIYGRLDCEEATAIRDMKNASRAPAPDCLQSDFQAMAYAYMKGGKAVQFDYLVENGTAITYAPRRAVFTDRDLEDTAATVDGAARAIQAGAFPCNRDGWWCSAKWCGYWDRCRGR